MCASLSVVGACDCAESASVSVADAVAVAVQRACCPQEESEGRGLFKF